MEYIDDLSYSNLSNLIQGEEIKGADLINNCALELEEVRAKISELESKLSQVKSREMSLLRASKYIATHLKKDLPLAVQRNGYIVVLSEANLTIERNVM